jgi:hypothetical protein
VVQQLEVGGARQVHAVVDLEREPSLLPAAGGARELHEQVAHQ